MSEQEKHPVSVEKIILDYPITFEGKKIDSLSMRRPRVRDQMIADKQHKDDMDKEMHLFSLLLDIDVEAIYDLDVIDYQKVTATYENFLKRGSQNKK
ncbi:phage tail assembly protein [Shewanella surugensis]|uniref:Phage tail assembly protein n=1 Tax=Shewanella surugensis TaxID=212020 RepID=A0ABT0L9Y9_9GAMM|nr:phage tail assembly protein [Shewanella surugensis]MCL1124167.1 phage tail assembly protein [Shewanella surugensis]